MSQPIFSFKVRPPPYQMHGILHYLQHEWSRYEMDRAKWELEKAEMQVEYQSFLIISSDGF